MSTHDYAAHDLSIPDALLALASGASVARPFASGAPLLAAAGLAVFPLGPDRKPLVRWGAAATTDPAVLGDWAARWPAAGIGIACKPSRLLVVDLDVKHPPISGPKSWAELTAASGDAGATPACLYDRTTLIKTRSGGFHLWFRDEPGSQHGRDDLLPGIDVKASQGDSGGFVVAPPTPGYSALGLMPPMPVPGWLALILAHGDKPRRGPGRETSPIVGARRGPGRETSPIVGANHGTAGRRFSGLIDKVLKAREGERNSCLYWASCRVAEMVRSGELTREQAEEALTQAARQVGLYQQEAAATIRSAFITAHGEVA